MKIRTMKEIFGDATPSEKLQMELRFQTDFCFFLERVLGITPAKFQEELLELLFKHKRIRIMCSRQHGKSLLFSQCYPIWRMYRDKGIQICLTSSAEKQSKDILREAKFRIEDNEYLREKLMPDKASKDWGSMDLITRDKSRFFLRPFNDTIKGIHPDIYILDDIVREEGVTQEQIKDKFRALVLPTLIATKGQCVLVGTAMTTDDLLFELDSEDEEGNKAFPEWKCRMIPIVKTDSEGNWLEPTWKEHLTLKEIKMMENEMGFVKFNRECMCNPLAGGDKIFPGEIVKRQLHNDMILNAPRPDCNYYLGIDVAYSKSKRADWTVFNIIEKDIKGICKQVRQDRPPRDNSTKNKIEKIRELHRIFGFRKILIEDRGLSKGLVVDVLDDPDLKHFSEGFKTMHGNKETIISHLSAGLSNGVLFILNNGILIKELSSFGVKKGKDGSETYESLGGHDDCVISLALAYEAATQMQGKAGIGIVTW